MSAADLAAVLLSVAGTAVLVLTVVVALSLLRTLRAVRSALVELRRETVPLVRAMSETVADAGAEVARVELLVERTEEITASLDASTRVVDQAVTGPLIRVVALVRGVGRGLSRSLVPGGRRRAQRRRARTAGRGGRPERRRDAVAERGRAA